MAFCLFKKTFTGSQTNVSFLLFKTNMLVVNHAFGEGALPRLIPILLSAGQHRRGGSGRQQTAGLVFLSPLHFDAFEGCVVVAQEVQVFSRIFFLGAIRGAECSWVHGSAPRDG